MARKGDKFKSYSKEFKLKAVRMHLEEGKGIGEIIHELGMKRHSYLQRWLKKYREFGDAGLEDGRGKTESPNRGRPRKNPMSPEEEILRLRAENAYLKELLKYQNEIKKKRKGES